MFEFTGRLKTLSYILILIGIISVGASFFTGRGHDEAHHGHEGTEHHEADGHHTEGHGDAHHGKDEHHAEDQHKADHGGSHHDDHHNSEYFEEHKDNFNYHKSASRATPDNNHYHRTMAEAHVDKEHLHHQMANKPWANLLVNNFFFLAIALGALFFLAIQYAAQAGWATLILRVMEAMSQFLVIPVMIMLLLVVTGVYHIGDNHLWHWMQEGIMDPESPHYDEIIAGKEGYLNGPFYLLRTLIYLIGWVGAAMLLRRMSLKMDRGGDVAAQWKKMRNLSAGFLVFFAVTSSTSAWDWIMSIDTHWFSTLFGWYTFAGIFVSSLTVLTLIIIYLKSKGYLEDVNENHIHDLGKFMFAFSIFWTYLWFSQFMLIWYSNIPEEVTYYMARFGEYKGLFFLMLAINFVFPVLVLMSRNTKRNYGFLVTAGIFIIIGHWLDVYIMVMPGTVGSLWSIGLVSIGTFLGFAGLFILVVFRSLAKAPLVSKNHPMLLESKYHHI